MWRTSFEHAASLYQAALDALPLGENPEEQRGKILMRLGSALGREGRIRDAGEAFREAARAGVSVASPSELPFVRDVKTLRESFERIVDRAPMVTTRFYEVLFTSHPHLRALFKRNSGPVQAKMMNDTLLAIIDRLEDAPWLRASLAAFGARHVEYDVTEDMYPMVGRSLIAGGAVTPSPTSAATTPKADAGAPPSADAGVAPVAAWTPKSLGSLAVWLRGDLGVHADAASKVTHWDDQSGQGNDATPVMGAEPVAKPGSLASLELTGTQMMTIKDAPSVRWTSDFTVIVVASSSQTAQTYGALYGKSASAYPYAGPALFTDYPGGKTPYVGSVGGRATSRPACCRTRSSRSSTTWRTRRGSPPRCTALVVATWATE